jgi:hypothetical protein
MLLPSPSSRRHQFVPLRPNQHFHPSMLTTKTVYFVHRGFRVMSAPESVRVAGRCVLA